MQMLDVQLECSHEFSGCYIHLPYSVSTLFKSKDFYQEGPGFVVFEAPDFYDGLDASKESVTSKVDADASSKTQKNPVYGPYGFFV